MDSRPARRKICTTPRDSAWVFGTACFDSMGFWPLRRRLCTTRHALLLESEYSCAFEGETSLFRLRFADVNL
eukprot:11199499-Lingulodinium_polyedra.AAC.1